MISDPSLGNVPEYTVEEISRQVKSTIESRFERVCIRGEVSSVSSPPSGHIYLTFKQDRHELAAVIWKYRANRLAAKPLQGIEYRATGSLTAYSGKSNYQLIVDRITEAGEGALLARLERLKAQLQAEGLFDAEKKRQIPFLPSVIGVVSSPGGAVIRDIIHVLRDRFPLHLLLWPVSVQGPSAAGEVERAIRGFNALDPSGQVPRPDLLIVARGGGSVEDLAAFSEEIVVRAAFESEIPLISAVGHETDTPLIDLAADLRAPTPSVAAEKSVPSRREITARLAAIDSRMISAWDRKAQQKTQRLRDLARGLPRPETLFAMPSQRLDHAAQSLAQAWQGLSQDCEIRLARLSSRLRRPEIISISGNRLSALSARLRPELVNIAGRLRRLEFAAGRLNAAGAAALDSKTRHLSELNRLLETLSYARVLKRGYAVVSGNGRIVTTREQARQLPELTIGFQDGDLQVDVKPTQ